MVFVYEKPIKKGEKETTRRKSEGKMSRRGAESDDDNGFVRRHKIAREAVRREAHGETPDPLARYLAQIGRERLLTHEEEIDLGRKVRAGDKKAREKLIEKNLRLVVSVAKK